MNLNLDVQPYLEIPRTTNTKISNGTIEHPIMSQQETVTIMTNKQQIALSNLDSHSTGVPATQQQNLDSVGLATTNAFNLDDHHIKESALSDINKRLANENIQKPHTSTHNSRREQPFMYGKGSDIKNQTFYKQNEGQKFFEEPKERLSNVERSDAAKFELASLSFVD